MFDLFKKKVNDSWWIRLRDEIYLNKLQPAIDKERIGRDDHYSFSSAMCDWSDFAQQIYGLFCTNGPERKEVTRDELLKTFYELEKDWLSSRIGKVAVTRQKLFKLALDEMRAELKTQGFTISDEENQSVRKQVDELVDNVAVQKRRQFSEWAARHSR